MRDLELALKAAGDPTRTRILKMLEAGELCVCQIQAVLGLAPSTVSKHLAILKLASLVQDRRDGQWTHYSLAVAGSNRHAPAVLALLRGPLDREPRVRADRRRLREVRSIPTAELCRINTARSPRSTPASRRARREGSRRD